MHPEMTARGDDQLAPAAGSAVLAALEATPCRDEVVGPAAINSRCTLHGSNTTTRLPAPVAIARGWHWPRVASQQAAGGIPRARECWGEASRPEAGSGLRWRQWCGHLDGGTGGVFICVCKYVSVHAFIYIYAYMNTCTHTQTHMYVCVSQCVPVCHPATTPGKGWPHWPPPAAGGRRPRRGGHHSAGARRRPVPLDSPPAEPAGLEAPAPARPYPRRSPPSPPWQQSGAVAMATRAWPGPDGPFLPAAAAAASRRRRGSPRLGAPRPAADGLPSGPGRAGKRSHLPSALESSWLAAFAAC